MVSIRHLSLACVATFIGMTLNASERGGSGLSISFGLPSAQAVSKSPGGSGEASSSEATSSSDTTSADRIMEPIDLATEYKKLKAEQEKEAAKEGKPEAKENNAETMKAAPEVTETTEEKKAPPKAEGEAAAATKGVYTNRPKEYSPSINSSERAILEALSARHQQLDQFEQDITVREKLLGAAEQRLDGRLKQLQSIESQLGATSEGGGGAADSSVPPRIVGNSGATPTQESLPSGEQPRPTPEMAALIAVYESMSPKAAAAVFEKLDSATILIIASGMTPRKLSAIVAAMDPEKASGVTDLMLGRQQRQKRVIVQVEQTR